MLPLPLSKMGEKQDRNAQRSAYKPIMIFMLIYVNYIDISFFGMPRTCVRLSSSMKGAVSLSNGSPDFSSASWSPSSRSELAGARSVAGARLARHLMTTDNIGFPIIK